MIMEEPTCTMSLGSASAPVEMSTQVFIDTINILEDVKMPEEMSLAVTPEGLKVLGVPNDMIDELIEYQRERYDETGLLILKKKKEYPWTK